MGPSTLILHQGADWVYPGYSPYLVAVIVLAGIGTTVLFLVSTIAYLQRRTLRFLFITVALAALVVRTVVGLGTMLGFVPMTMHHLASHSLDFFVAAVILYAVYRSSPDGETLPAD